MTTDRHPDSGNPDESASPDHSGRPHQQHLPDAGYPTDPLPPATEVPPPYPAASTDAPGQHPAPHGPVPNSTVPNSTVPNSTASNSTVPQGPPRYGSAPWERAYPATDQFPPPPPPGPATAGMMPPAGYASGTYGGPPMQTHPGSAPLRRSPMKPIIATALIAGLFGGAVALGGNALVEHTSSSVPQISAPAATSAAPAQPGSITYAAQAASKFTADIQVASSQGTAIGSGIVLSPDGYVLTNNHVISGAGAGSTIQATTADQKTYQATVVGASPSYDLAVIKLRDASGLTAAQMGNSSNLQVGQQVVAVGSPESLSNTVTSGIVSNLSRTVTAGDGQGSQVAVYNGLQTDTPINPGNSGGPLVNLSGQVIGVNSAVDTGSSSQNGVQAFGLGFAIPVDTARRVANELLADGQATKPVLGVTGSLSESDTTATQGAQVTAVSANGAAAAAGVRAGDVITKVGDERVTNYADLMAQILTHKPGETVPLTITSGGNQRTVSVTLGSAVDTEQTTVPSRGAP